MRLAKSRREGSARNAATAAHVAATAAMTTALARKWGRRLKCKRCNHKGRAMVILSDQRWIGRD
jgi:hypothetical protein